MVHLSVENVTAEAVVLVEKIFDMLLQGNNTIISS